MPTTLIEFIYINSNTIKEDKRIHTVFIKDGEMFINIDMVECYSVGKFGGIKVNFNLAPVGWCYWPISLKSKISVEDVISYIGFAKKISEQEEVPVIVDLTEGIPKIEKLRLPSCELELGKD